METSTVRAGKQAVAITVHSRDKFEAGENGDADSERDELREANYLVSHQDKSYEYSFSMYFPDNFPIVPVRLVIAQWKQYSNGYANVSPVLALRYIGGELSVTQDIQHQYHVLYKKRGEFRGRWLDFRVQARFTPQANGHVKVWLNKKQIVDFTGVTANEENASTHFADPSFFFFKMGLYRNVMTQPMTVYIDEYRKRELRDSELR